MGCPRARSTPTALPMCRLRKCDTFTMSEQTYMLHLLLVQAGTSLLLDNDDAVYTDNIRHTCGGAADSLDGVGLYGAQAVDLGDQDGHTQVLEGARVANAAVLHPQVAHPKLAPKALRPEQVAVPLKHALYVVILDLLQRTHPQPCISSMAAQCRTLLKAHSL